MKNQSVEEQKERLQRSLNRLQDSVRHKSIVQLLPAFKYTTNLMDSYMNLEVKKHEKQNYLHIFADITHQFRLRVQTETHKNTILLSHNKKNILKELLVELQNYQRDVNTEQLNKQINTKFGQDKMAEVYKNIEKFYQQHNLDRAYTQIELLQRLSDKKDQSQLHLSLEMEEKIFKIKRQYWKMIHFYEQFRGTDWIFDKQENNVRLEYKVLEQDRAIAVNRSRD